MNTSTTIQLSQLEARVLVQAAELALAHDPQNSVFFADHKSALLRAVRKVEDFLGECKEVADSD